MHVHGGGGASFDGGSPEQVAWVVGTHRDHGTTTMVASLVTDRSTLLAASSRRWPTWSRRRLAGIHLEGPWLARPRGAHDPALLREPDPAEIDALLEAGRGT